MEAGRERPRSRIVTSPDHRMPAQEPQRYELPALPERRLLQAVLEDALNELRMFYPYRNAVGTMAPHVFKGWKRFTDAQAWLQDGERTDTFGARPICDVLGIDYEAMLTSLTRHHWRPGAPGLRYSGRGTGAPTALRGVA